MSYGSLLVLGMRLWYITITLISRLALTLRLCIGRLHVHVSCYAQNSISKECIRIVPFFSSNRSADFSATFQIEKFTRNSFQIILQCSYLLLVNHPIRNYVSWYSFVGGKCAKLPVRLKSASENTGLERIWTYSVYPKNGF